MSITTLLTSIVSILASIEQVNTTLDSLTLMLLLYRELVYHSDENLCLFSFQLLEKDPAQRLGHRNGKHGEVADQPFFKNVDFVILERKQVNPPYKPNLVSAA